MNEWVSGLSDEQVRIELEGLRSRLVDEKLEGFKRPQWRAADLRAAHAQVLMKAAGVPVPGDLHPLAEQMLANGAAPGFEAMGRARAIAERGPRGPGGGILAKSWPSPLLPPIMAICSPIYSTPS